MSLTMNPMKSKKLCVILLVAAAVGCDRGPATAPVHGKVTVGGKAVPTGTVQFYSTTGGPPAVGQIRKDGSYVMARKVPGDEVVLGEYQVTIEAMASSSGARSDGPKTFEEELESESSSPGQVLAESLVPEKYASLESTDLTATVTDGDNEINFDLP